MLHELKRERFARARSFAATIGATANSGMGSDRSK
jgi:hypothetical protein